MSAKMKRSLFWSAAALALIAGIVWSLRPRPVPVDVAVVVEQPMVVTVDEEGQTRVRDVFVVSAPVSGRMRRSTLEVGDTTVAGETMVAEIEPMDPAFLDQRARAEAQAEVARAEAALTLARAEVDQAQAELDFARSELERARRLSATGTISNRAVDDALRVFRSRRAALATAKASVQVSEHTLERTRLRLTSPAMITSRSGECDCVVLTAPVSGRVLELHRESEGVVEVGTPLVSLGDPARLELTAELLSTDAVKLRGGMRVIVEGWGGDGPLSAVVDRVEPFGFTKLSALGIEEQRVNVVMTLTGDAEAWAALGHGFRVDVRVVIWESDAALTVPLTALFRTADGDAVFVDDDGVARLRQVRTGRRAGITVQVLEGLQAGERVVLSPGDRIEDGVLIAARSGS
jgi:HlyD family secretion protein